MSPTDYGWLVLLFPLLGTVLIMLGLAALARPQRGLDRQRRHRPGVRLVDRDAADAQRPARGGQVADRHRVRATSARPGFNADLSILVDPLSIVMCLVVTGVSFLIHLYSVSYMTSDPGFTRFFAYLNFFVFSMLLLVLAANFVLLIVGWAFVGAASYLLISFWYRRATATAAGIKAFVINVVGDIGLVIGAFLLFDKTGALDYPGVFLRAPEVFSHQRPPAGDRLPAAAGGRVRQVGPAAAAHLAARRHGGPHPGLGADPRGHHGHRGRVPDRALPPAVRAGPHRRRRRARSSAAPR